jgi:hypothetical protein
MKVGDQVRIVTRKRRAKLGNPNFTRKMETYRLPEEEQRIGTVIKMGAHVNQMTILTQDGKVKFWFNHQCEVVS